MKIEVVEGSILDLGVDAIVNPANSAGRMGGGVAKVIKKAGGREIEKEAMDKAPIAVGEAVLTTGGTLKARHVIHAPTMVKPAERTNVQKVRAATDAALKCADEAGLKSIAFPGMGTGVGRVKPEDAAQCMVEAIRGFEGTALRKVVLVDMSPEMAQAFREATEA
ncbi:MAG: macro domain-containing protein [Planctomycetes bacterium]|nr:macro domain-containing protein [Planctomycetota bacterium]